MSAPVFTIVIKPNGQGKCTIDPQEPPHAQAGDAIVFSNATETNVTVDLDPPVPGGHLVLSPGENGIIVIPAPAADEYEIVIPCYFGNDKGGPKLIIDPPK